MISSVFFISKILYTTYFSLRLVEPTIRPPRSIVPDSPHHWKKKLIHPHFTGENATCNGCLATRPFGTKKHGDRVENGAGGLYCQIVFSTSRPFDDSLWSPHISWHVEGANPRLATTQGAVLVFEELLVRFIKAHWPYFEEKAPCK